MFKINRNGHFFSYHFSCSSFCLCTLFLLSTGKCNKRRRRSMLVLVRQHPFLLQQTVHVRRQKNKVYNQPLLFTFLLFFSLPSLVRSWVVQKNKRRRRLMSTLVAGPLWTVDCNDDGGSARQHQTIKVRKRSYGHRGVIVIGIGTGVFESSGAHVIWIFFKKFN